MLAKNDLKMRLEKSQCRIYTELVAEEKRIPGGSYYQTGEGHRHHATDSRAKRAKSRWWFWSRRGWDRYPFSTTIRPVLVPVQSRFNLQSSQDLVCLSTARAGLRAMALCILLYTSPLSTGKLCVYNCCFWFCVASLASKRDFWFVKHFMCPVFGCVATNCELRSMKFSLNRQIRKEVQWHGTQLFKRFNTTFYISDTWCLAAFLTRDVSL